MEKKTFLGEFKNRENNKTYKVQIGNTGSIRQIIDPLDRSFKYSNEVIMFDEDPVLITYERSKLEQQILIRQAEIRIKSNYNLSDYLFANTNRAIPVMIHQKVNGQWVSVFNGYVDPLQFNQSISYQFENYTIHATDPLGALEDLKVDKLERYGVNISSTPGIKELIDAIAHAIGCDTDYTQWVNSPNMPNNDIILNASIFYGESKDDYKTLYDILENLLIYQGAMMYYNPVNNKVRLMNMYTSNSTNIDFSLVSNAMDNSSNLSTSDAYNQIKLKCNIQPAPEDISLIDDDKMESDYFTYQKYMTELISGGRDGDGYEDFRSLLNGTDNLEWAPGNLAYRDEWFCWIKKNKAWDFGEEGYTSLPKYEDQSEYLKWLKNNTGKALFVSFGNSGKIKDDDNSPLQNVQMKDYLVISCNGHDDHSINGHNKTVREMLDANKPICTYKGLASVTLTPTDENITNYVVISGKILLNPIQERSGSSWSNHYNKTTNTYNNAYTYFNPPYSSSIVGILYSFGHKIKHDIHGDGGAYYTQKFWRCTDPVYPSYTLADNGSTIKTIPFLNNGANKDCQYTESFYAKKFDTLSKMPILICQLKVGDKYCVERLDRGRRGTGVYKWYTLEQCNQLGIQPWFSIGIDPKKNDYIIGQEHEIANNIWYYNNIEQKGTAIPITIEDQLNGVPEFSIIAPYNMIWSDNYCFYPKSLTDVSFDDFQWRDLGQDPKFILELLDSIMIQDLNISFVSNNAGVREGMTTADNDLVYCSNVDLTYLNDNESNIDICTPLTMDECIISGIKYQLSSSYIRYSDSNPFYGWTYNNDTEIVKPEQMWVDYMYKQYCEPRKILETNIKDTLFVDEQSSGTDIGKWMTNGTINGVIGTEDSKFNKGLLTKIEWNLKNRSMKVEITEAADYIADWDEESEVQ